MKENEIYQQVKKAYQTYMPDTAEGDESNLQWQRVLEACRQFPENAQYWMPDVVTGGISGT